MGADAGRERKRLRLRFLASERLHLVVDPPPPVVGLDRPGGWAAREDPHVELLDREHDVHHPGLRNTVALRPSPPTPELPLHRDHRRRGGLRARLGTPADDRLDGARACRSGVAGPGRGKEETDRRRKIRWGVLGAAPGGRRPGDPDPPLDSTLQGSAPRARGALPGARHPLRRPRVARRGTERWLQHDAANQLLSIASDPAGTQILWSFAYDPNGNPTSRTTRDLSGWITYTWDVQDRLVEVQDAATGQTWTHAYDARGRRVAQTAPEKDRAYTWAGDNRVGEYAAGAQVARFTYGAALDDAIHVARDGTSAHLHADALGTVVSASSDSGVELVSYAYDAFGALRSSSGSFENDLAFTGRVHDTSGLLYYRARFYDPALGRFLNPDPIRFEGGINFYAYAGNNPTTLTDPTGEVAAPIVFGAILGGAVAYRDARKDNPNADFFSREILGEVAIGATIGGTGGLVGAGVSGGLARLFSSSRIAQNVLRGERSIDVVSGAFVGAFEGFVNEYRNPDEVGKLDFAIDVVSGGIGGHVANVVDARLARTEFLGFHEGIREYADEAIGAFVGAVANAGLDRVAAAPRFAGVGPSSVVPIPKPQPPPVSVSIK